MMTISSLLARRLTLKTVRGVGGKANTVDFYLSSCPVLVNTFFEVISDTVQKYLWKIEYYFEFYQKSIFLL